MKIQHRNILLVLGLLVVMCFAMMWTSRSSAYRMDSVQISLKKVPSSNNPDNSWVLITGGAGYVGSHAALYLLERKRRVIVVDDMSRGSDLAIKELNKFREFFKFEQFDIRDRPKLQNLFRKHKVDAVIHFASVAYVQESIELPELYKQNITENTKALADIMIENGISKLIYSSTCAVYGIPVDLPLTESSAPYPVSPYGHAKLAAEKYLEQRSSRSFQVFTLRYFNVIGADPGGRLGENVHPSVKNFGRLWTACVRTALGLQKFVSVHGFKLDTYDGTAIRDYVHVWDLVEAHVSVLARFPLSDNYMVSNLGTGKGTSTMDFIETFRRVSNIFIPVKFESDKPGNPPMLFSNGGRLFVEGVWQPKFVNLSIALMTAWKYAIKNTTPRNPLHHQYDVCIVGAGLSGAVLAERHSNVHGHKVLVLEKRDHIGGNCYDYVDKETGIRVSKYGVHLFHTKSKRVWEYVQNLTTWTKWEHRVVASVGNRFVPVPVNIDTVNQLFGLNITNTQSMLAWLNDQRVSFGREPRNSEEMGLSRIGPKLFDLLIKPYTMKQWEKHPKDLDASVVGRIPVRMTNEDRYFTDPYQALPSNGYTRIFENIFALTGITIMLRTDFFKVRNSLQCKKLYYTGPIDAYFSQEGLAKLEYRSLKFERKVFRNTQYFQPKSQVNYPSMDYNFTRIVEYKHLLNQKSPHTVIFIEYSSAQGEPYYPIPNTRNINLYKRYQELSKTHSNVSFVGRLANYKYFNMDQTILNALELFDNETSAQFHPRTHHVDYFANHMSIPVNLMQHLDSFYSTFKIPAQIVVNSTRFLWRDLDLFVRLALLKNVCVRSEARRQGKFYSGEFGYELTGRLKDVYREACLEGELRETASLVGMEPFYFFNLGRHTVHKTRRIVQMDAKHCTETTATFPPMVHYFSRISKIAVSERFAVVHNKLHKEWNRPPINFFTVPELEFIFRWIFELYPNLSILYICHRDKEMEDQFPTLPLADYDDLLRKYSSRVHVFEDLIAPVMHNTHFGDLPKLTLKNLLQIALIAQADIAFTVQGGLQHLISKLVPVSHVLHLHGGELMDTNKLGYACQSQSKAVHEMTIYTTRDALARRFKNRESCTHTQKCKTCNRFPTCPCLVCSFSVPAGVGALAMSDGTGHL